MTAAPSVTMSLADVPDPAITYVVDDEPRITTANEAFEELFDGVDVGSPVSAVFQRFSDVTSTGGGDPVAHLRQGDHVGVYLDGFDDTGPWFARVIAGDDGTGYLVLTELDRHVDDSESVAVDRVGSVLSHELRNPLDVAEAHLGAARETGADEHFDAVADAHDRMERIIRDVLTVTRGPSTVTSSEPVSIETAARDAWASVDTQRSRLELSERLPTVAADPGRVRRLFENLFRNSVEHGSTNNRPEAGDSVEHGSTESRAMPGDSEASETPRTAGDAGDSVEHGSTESRAEPGERDIREERGSTVTITVGAGEGGFYVADDGPGIPAGKRDVVFEPGYSTRADGTGLGLAIVERIVTAHGWDLTLTTGAAGGVRFEIEVETDD